MYLQAKGEFPNDISSFRYNTITWEALGAFIIHSDSMRLLSSTGDITTSLLPSSGLTPIAINLYSLTETFKKSIKRDASHFISFKDGKF